MRAPIRHHPGSGMESYAHGNITEQRPTAQMWTDASYKKGAMGLGIVLLSETSTKPLTWVVRCKEAGHDSTQAELHALNFALCQAHKNGHTNIVLHTDASMAIWHTANKTALYDVMPALQSALSKMESVQLCWVARERNEMANALSRMALSLPYSYAAGLTVKNTLSKRVDEWTPTFNPS